MAYLVSLGTSDEQTRNAALVVVADALLWIAPSDVDGRRPNDRTSC